MSALQPSPARRASLCLVLSLLTAGAGFAACSSSSTKATSHTDAGPGDAAGVDADEDASLDAGAVPDDVTIYPEAPSMTAPDGCLLLGATCLDESMCCSAYCVEGGCSAMPVKM